MQSPIQSTAATDRPVTPDIPLYLKGTRNFSRDLQPPPKSGENRALHKQVPTKKRWPGKGGLEAIQRKVNGFIIWDSDGPAL